MVSTPQFRLSRLNIFWVDFKQAQRFALFIVRRKLHTVKNPQAVAKLIHLAFNTSLIVAYSRPFLDSNDGAKKKVSLRDAVNALLDTPEQMLSRQDHQKDEESGVRTLGCGSARDRRFQL
jgi:hypothetical protein